PHPADLDVGDVRSPDTGGGCGLQAVVHLFVGERTDVDGDVGVALLKLLGHRVVPLVPVVRESPELQGLCERRIYTQGQEQKHPYDARTGDLHYLPPISRIDASREIPARLAEGSRIPVSPLSPQGSPPPEALSNRVLFTN